MDRGYWRSEAEHLAQRGQRDWAAAEPAWFDCLAADMRGVEAVELGCGTASVSAWLARRGAHPVGVDGSKENLAVARALQEQHRIRFPLYLGDPEATPFSEASFDLAVSGPGGTSWRTSYRWLLEAARILRPGGRLVFVTDTALSRSDLDALLYASGMGTEEVRHSGTSSMSCVVASRYP